MIPVYLCEDNEEQLQVFKKLIENTIIISEWDMKVAASVSSPVELLDSINKAKPETAIYFLDIELESTMNGIDLAVEIRKYDPRAFIIFITAHSDMAFHTLKYKVEPLGYIMKEDPDFKNQVKDCLQNAYEKYQVPLNPIIDILTVYTERRMLMVPLNDIYFIEPSYQSHKIRLHKKHEILEFTSTLSEVILKLDERFMQCHKAYIVNCNHIRRVDKDNYTVYFDNGKNCPCSVRLCNPLCNKLSEFRKQ